MNPEGPSDAVVLQRRPGGSQGRATVAWKLKVIRRMNDLDMSQAELARACDVSPASINQLLGKVGAPARELKESGCRYIAKVHAALSWPPPADEPAMAAGTTPVPVVRSAGLRDFIKSTADELDDAEVREIAGYLAGYMAAKNKT